MKQSLENISLKTTDAFLGLQMKRGTIKEGEQQIDGFVQSILKK